MIVMPPPPPPPGGTGKSPSAISLPSTTDAGAIIASLGQMVHELGLYRANYGHGAKQLRDFDEIILNLGKAAHVVALTSAKPGIMA